MPLHAGRRLRETGDITANWITRNQGQGQVLLYEKAGQVRLRLTNTVRYASHILSTREKNEAIYLAHQRIVLQLRISADYELRKLRAAA